MIGLLDEITPLRIELSRRPQRAVSIGRPSSLDFLPGTGVRVRTDAEILWDVIGLAVPVTARTLQLMLAPRLDVKDGHHVLTLEPRLEELELEGVPSFVEHRIAAIVNDGVDRQRSRLTWDLDRVLLRDLPPRVSPPTRIGLGVLDASVVVERDGLVLEVTFEARARRVVPHLRAVGDGQAR